MSQALVPSSLQLPWSIQLILFGVICRGRRDSIALLAAPAKDVVCFARQYRINHDSGVLNS